MPTTHESNDNELRTITINFIPTAKARSAYYVVVDYTAHTPIGEVDTLPYVVVERPILGVLVQHIIEDTHGLCDSQVVYAVYDEDMHEFVGVQDVVEFDPGSVLIGVYDGAEVPSSEHIENGVDSARYGISRRLGEFQLRAA